MGFENVNLWFAKDKNNEKNNGSIRDITGKDSKVKVLVVPTNEELAICRDTVALVK